LEKAGHNDQGAGASWYTTGIIHPGLPTLNDRSMLTAGILAGPSMIMNPWRAPGSAPIQSPCGSGYTQASNDGLNLPASVKTSWKRGTSVKAAWAIYQNHGGGYSWRLCPQTEKPTEACFQAHPLTSPDNTTTVHWTDGREETIPTRRTTIGGVQWTRNPIPSDEVGGLPFMPPCSGCMGGFNDFSLVDNLAIPADLPLGEYLLSWRWDCEITTQSWQNCADISIVDEMPPAPIPSTIV